MGDAHCAHKENGCWRALAQEFGELDSLLSFYISNVLYKWQ